jgi:hypothetical protein
MSKFYAFINGSNSGEVTLTSQKPLGKGATAAVYSGKFAGRPVAVKLYNDRSHINVEKLTAMIGSPPTLDSDSNTAEISSWAWPEALLKNDVDFCGYIMQLVDVEHSFPLDYYYDRTLFNKLGSPDEAALSFKLEIAQNLCRVVRDLHDRGHYFIDVKPQNIRVYRGTHQLTVLDCDGFSISAPNGKRFPAALISTDYICPEAFKANSSPKTLGEEQDNYALAVIIFQLLNWGTHPFQGIGFGNTQLPATNDEKAAKGFYPHGLSPHPSISPRPTSVHDCWPKDLRIMFDRAFGTDGTRRPTAREWMLLLEILGSSKLKRCALKPNDVNHIHFDGEPCGACKVASVPAPQVVSSVQTATNSPARATQPTTLSTPSGADGSRIPVIVLVSVIALGFIVLVLGSFTQSEGRVSNLPSVPAAAQDLATSGLPVPEADMPPSGAQTPPTEIEAQPMTFVAAAIADSRRGGFAYGGSDEGQTKSVALESCRESAPDPSTCRIILSIQEKCISWATDPETGAIGVAGGGSRKSASQRALRACAKEGGLSCEVPKNDSQCAQ